MSADVVAIIPARGGSSRIPGKNSMGFNGRPIITWPLQACSQLVTISQTVVSTDAEEIAQIARQAGSTSVIDRPAELATHTAGTAPVIRHAIDELDVEDDAVVMCLHPDKFVITVGRHRSPHERSLEPRDGGLMSLSSTDELLTRTQDLPQRYFDAGKLYVAKASVWKARETMMEVPFVPFHLPDWAAVDIDEPEDWAIAEALHRVFVLETS